MNTRSTSVKFIPFRFPPTRPRPPRSTLSPSLTAILSANQTLTASFHLAPHRLTYSGLDYFNPQPVTPNISQHESTGTVIHRLAIGSGLLQSTLAMTRVSTEIDPQGSSEMVLTPSRKSGQLLRSGIALGDTISMD